MALQQVNIYANSPTGICPRAPHRRRGISPPNRAPLRAVALVSFCCAVPEQPHQSEGVGTDYDVDVEVSLPLQGTCLRGIVLIRSFSV